MASTVSIPDRDFAQAASVRVAVVRHVGIGGGDESGDHLDLFVGPLSAASPEVRSVRCWRLPLAAWGAEGLAVGRFAAEEIALHRAEYLELTAPRELSGGRGRVEPLARGGGTATPGVPLVVRALGRRIELGLNDAVIATVLADAVAEEGQSS